MMQLFYLLKGTICQQIQQLQLKLEIVTLAIVAESSN